MDDERMAVEKKIRKLEKRLEKMDGEDMLKRTRDQLKQREADGIRLTEEKSHAQEALRNAWIAIRKLMTDHPEDAGTGFYVGVKAMYQATVYG